MFIIDKRNRKKGFTLIELIVVIALLAILIAILVPSLTGYIGKTQTVACQNNRQQVVRLYQYYSVETGGTGSMANFDLYVAGNGIDVAKLCPAGGVCTFAVSDNNQLIITCSRHDADSTPSTEPKDYIVDKDGNQLTLVVTDVVPGQSLNSISGKVIYYEGDDNGYEAGYYYVSGDYAPNALITNLSDDIQTQIVQGKAHREYLFRRIDLDAPIETYDWSKYKDIKPASALDAAVREDMVYGRFYYVNFDWDDNPEPVLAMYRGNDKNNANHNQVGDLSLDSKSNAKSYWIIPEFEED